jgi:hypothetical protein
MSASAATILGHLNAVAAERARRATDPSLEARVAGVKRFQQKRFAQTYADLLASPRYAAVARFFLDELYGPGDFSRRDTQFARMVPAMSRLFPGELVETVAELAELHALTETFDTAMAEALGDERPLAADYARAWQRVGRPADRERQIVLTLAIAADLDRYTRKVWLRKSLHFMRGPARAAGLSDLHRFLEVGFDIFRAMNGAAEFIALVDRRERALAAALFDTGFDAASAAALDGAA